MLLYIWCYMTILIKINILFNALVQSIPSLANCLSKIKILFYYYSILYYKFTLNLLNIFKLTCRQYST